MIERTPQIPGQQYGPLVAEIQKQLPGVRLWTGVTSGWLGNFPNPIEIAGAVDDCVSKAQEQGLHTTNVYMAGHSLGGIMLETWIENNPDRAAGDSFFKEREIHVSSDSFPNRNCPSRLLPP